MSRNAVFATLLVVLAAGLAVRAVRLFEVARAPDYAHPAVDAGFHDWWARTLSAVPLEDVEGRDPALLERAYLRPPGYPWLLAAVYRASGGSYLAPRLLQCALGLLSVVLAWELARRAFGQVEGLLAAAGLALHWVVVYFETELQATSVVICLLLVGLLLLARWATAPRAAPALAAGVVLGAAALVRPNALFVMLAALLWMLWVARRRGVRARAAAFGLVVATLAALAPATVRNALVAGDLVLVSSNAGINLYIGNNERANGLVAGHLPGVGRFDTCFDYPALVRRVEKKEGRELRDSEVSAWFAGRALDWIAENPGRALRLTGRKALLFFGPQELAHNKELQLERAHSGVLRWLPAPFAAVLALALVGLYCALRRPGASRELALLLALVVLAWFLSVVPFFAAARYRVPILPPLLLLAAVAVADIGRELWSGRRLRGSVLAGAAALLFAGLSWSPYDVQPDVEKWHLDRGRALRRAGAELEAVEELRQALAAGPGSLDVQLTLADALVACGEPDEAAGHYAAVLAKRPNEARALGNYGALLSGRGQHGRAIELFERALKHDSDTARAHVNLALALERAGRDPAAADHFRKALELRPGFGLARRGLRRVELRGGSDDDAGPPP
jgi:tetratricopeptide (TPR) repeat protein